MRATLRAAAVALIAFGAATQAGRGWCDAGFLGLLLLAATDLPALWRRDAGGAVVAPLPAGAVGLLAVVAAAWAAAGWPGTGLRDLVQLAGLLGLGIAVGRGLSTLERRLLSFASASVLALSLLAAVWQLAAPVSGARLVALLHGQPYASGGSGPALAEELAVGLLPSHCLYATFVTTAIALVIAAVPATSGSVRLAVALILVLVAGQTLFSAGALVVLGAGALLSLSSVPEATRPRRVWLCALLIAVALALAPQHCFGPASPPSPWEYLQPFSNPPNAERQVKRLGLEIAATIESLAERPLGRGPGTYKASVTRARIEAGLPHPLENRVRRDSNSQYLVLGLECGWVAIACLLFLLAAAIGRALSTALPWSRQPGPEGQGAVAAALVGVALSGLLSLIFVRGFGPLACLLVGMAYAPKAGDPPAMPWRRRLGLLCAQAGLVVLAALIPWRAVLASASSPPATPAARGPDTGTVLVVEAEDCVSYAPALGLEAASDAGGHRGLVIPAGAGKNAGDAVYRVQVPHPGPYKPWVRAFWTGGCSNSVLLQVGTGRTLTLEDSILNRWHWVDVGSGQTVDLPSGEVTFRLKSAEDGVKIDQIAFLADPTAVPLSILDRSQAPKTEKSPAAPDATHPPRFDDSETPNDQAFDKYK